ncbi:MAG: UDP-N-acetylmuramate dehydrogenase [Candidatus Sabulitectum sp.]|nr:UDP-N-acetylmuramate dehydrogenase [Candidatus Sabulitectum sp.]
MIYDKAINTDPDRFHVIELAEYTTWGIGGPAASITVNSEEELTGTLEFLAENSLQWVVLGKGSNTLAPTEGWHGVVILSGGEFADFSFNGNVLTAGGGAHLPSMSGAACSLGLTGLVFAVGIPGTAGGAVFMNAGAYGSSVSELVREVKVLHPQGSIEYLTGEDCGFGYRTSRFQTDDSIILKVVMKLSYGPGSRDDLRRNARDILRLRREKFPLHAPNAGSVFRRPDNGPPPGKLIEDRGLKGFRMGGAMVSPTHANFIENTGGATSSDVMQLIELVARRVREATGITLKREIRRLGERI